MTVTIKPYKYAKTMEVTVTFADIYGHNCQLIPPAGYEFTGEILPFSAMKEGDVFLAHGANGGVPTAIVVGSKQSSLECRAMLRKLPDPPQAPTRHTLVFEYIGFLAPEEGQIYVRDGHYFFWYGSNHSGTKYHTYRMAYPPQGK